MRCISELCAARSLGLVFDMSAPAALLRLELHPHLAEVVQRFLAGKETFQAV
ncbi:lipoprotein signal peptidase [Neisseria dentiae]|uniref:lipoprotein signal peptidase n=1 Tax=Neisseria dentiae TaxID=194197 RepID=UPI0035A0FEF8